MKPITLPATTVQEVEEVLREAKLLGPSETLPRTLVGQVRLSEPQRVFLADRAEKLLRELRHKEFLKTQDIRKRAEERRQRRNAKRLLHAHQH